MHIEVAKANTEQAVQLASVALAAKRHWDYPERWIEIWTPVLTITPEFIAAADVRTAVLDGEVAGFYALTYSDDRAVLEHFWVLPRYMGRGIGRRLWEHALARCRNNGCTILEIESDPNAQGFYEKMGARKVGERVSELDGQSRVLPVLEINL